MGVSFFRQRKKVYTNSLEQKLVLLVKLKEGYQGSKGKYWGSMTWEEGSTVSWLLYLFFVTSQVLSTYVKPNSQILTSVSEREMNSKWGSTKNLQYPLHFPQLHRDPCCGYHVLILMTTYLTRQLRSICHIWSLPSWNASFGSRNFSHLVFIQTHHLHFLVCLTLFLSVYIWIPLKMYPKLSPRPLPLPYQYSLPSRFIILNISVS